MKLAYLEVCGFRGFRERVRIEFGSGFTVVTGRNGVGKSSLFDAVEFALTGVISKYPVEKARNESVADYVWWRGEGSPVDNYVTLAFQKGDGKAFTITRTRSTGADKTDEEIEAALCHTPAPDDAVRRLSSTSIIRDEWIAALSLDLSETDRFELVRAALGPVQGVELGAKAKAVVGALEANHSRMQDDYRSARAQLTEALGELSEAKEVAARIGDIEAAMQILVAAVPSATDEIGARLVAGRAALTTGRVRLAVLSEAVVRFADVRASRDALDAPEAIEELESARTRLADANEVSETAEREATMAEAILAAEAQTDEIAVSLAGLISHGENLGLNHGHCPLCAAERTIEEFLVGLAQARQRMSELASGVAIHRDRAAAARVVATKAATELEAAERAWQAIESKRTEITAKVLAFEELLKEHGLEARQADNIDGLRQYLSVERDRLLEMERALLTLEASQSIAKIHSLEGRIETLRKQADAAAAKVEATERGLAVAKALDRGVRSVSGEIIDERLAQISPLLNELYQRLRPHSDWRSIEYTIRGDVRRFLSLTVGQGLNPQFVFSSGQRRAAGLAFLLSVHLARSWTPWRTLLLDDPVQHIDDFRALHLVEVLAALRLDDRQIVCAVEDPALAELLCRRLLSSPTSIGKRYDLDVDVNGSAVVEVDAEVHPMLVSALRAPFDMRDGAH